MLCNKFFKELNLHEGLLAYDYHVDFIASIHIGDKYHRRVDVIEHLPVSKIIIINRAEP